MPSAVCRALIAVLCVLVALFFGFVGWNKAFAPLADLVRHGAWTVHLPDLAGRLVGWSEMLLALAMLTIALPAQRGIARAAALLLIVNQLCAALVHALHGEMAALPQNAILIALLGLIVRLARPSPSLMQQE